MSDSDPSSATSAADGGEDGWGDGPIWIQPADGSEPRCDEHGEIVTPRPVEIIVERDGDRVLHELRAGFGLYYCPRCFGGEPTAGRPLGDTEAARRALVAALQEQWGGSLAPYFEAVGAPPAETEAEAIAPAATSGGATGAGGGLAERLRKRWREHQGADN